MQDPLQPPTTEHNVSAKTVVEQLFRSESGKLASSLTRAFGLARLIDVEDIVQDALLAALNDWSFRGVPENPTAWLHRVAKNKAVDHIRRRKFESQETTDLIPGLREASYTSQIERDFLDWQIDDSQLMMMFACCHPGLPAESQIALTLKTLCGFSVREIASAFLTNEATIEKRLGRARKYFREHHVSFDVPSEQAITDRMAAVLKSLYLLFNEGYKRTDHDGLLDRDLCLEALRLALLVAQHPRAASPEANALVALMSFLAARFEARTDGDGHIVLLSDQDRSQWSSELIARAFEYLARSEPDLYTSKYHIEATIQAIYTRAASFEETNWAAVLALYQELYALDPNPIVALHLSVSLGEVQGARQAVEWLEKNPLPNYYLYHALLADAEAKAGMFERAKASYNRAIELAMNSRERELLEKKLEMLSKRTPHANAELRVPPHRSQQAR
jgi:RNA polymerase sigma factor (sigma-70 family)